MADQFHDPNNPYASPESALVPATSSGGVQGGTLEATLAGQTTWTIGEVVSDAWRLTSGFKGTFWLAILAMMGVQIVVGIAQAVLEQNEGPIAVIAFIGMMIVTVAVVWPLQMGLWMLGVRRAAGAETRASMVGDYIKESPRIAGLLILQAILIGLGFLCLIIPGIYLAVSYILAPPLLLDRRMGIWEALETSRKAIGTCWFQTFGLLLLSIPVSLVCLLTLGIAYIWVAPAFMVALGVLYQRLVGYVGDDAA